jgi:hypothetical protein
MAKEQSDVDAKLDCYRKVRDQIRMFIEKDLKGLLPDD